MTPYALSLNKNMFKQIRKAISIAILVAFISTSVQRPVFAQSVQGGMMPLPVPGSMVQLSSEFTPAHLQGITIHPDNALQFDFLIHQADDSLSIGQKEEEYTKLVRYFLASLTIPDDNQWVNLSPYEKNRIIKDDFGKTEMGRDLLAQDYMLKQITSSLIYPEDGVGKKFWNTIYERAWQEYHTTDIPVNTFNKVWIVPDQAFIYESGNTAYILKSHLKVMLEEDYMSLQKHTGIIGSNTAPSNDTHAIGSQVIREIVLPELEKEVNEGKNFANLRQMYSGMILATWYKKALKESLLGKVYADRSKVKGVDQDPQNNEVIYQRYLKAFKKGVFNYIKEDVDKYTNETIPRKYFSGGFEKNINVVNVDQSMTTDQIKQAASVPGNAIVINGQMQRAPQILKALFPSDIGAIVGDVQKSNKVVITVDFLTSADDKFLASLKPTSSLRKPSVNAGWIRALNTAISRNAATKGGSLTRFQKWANAGIKKLPRDSQQVPFLQDLIEEAQIQLDSAMIVSPEAQRANSGFRILIVDDEPVLRELAVTVLSKYAGFQVETAEDGQHAFEIIKSHPQGYYFRIFSDNDMPRMSGTELVQEVRKIDPNQKFVMHTGRDPQAVRAILPDVPVLAKPYPATTLINTFNDLRKQVQPDVAMTVQEVRETARKMLDSYRRTPAFVLPEELRNPKSSNGADLDLLERQKKEYWRSKLFGIVSTWLRETKSDIKDADAIDIITDFLGLRFKSVDDKTWTYTFELAPRNVSLAVQDGVFLENGNKYSPEAMRLASLAFKQIALDTQQSLANNFPNMPVIQLKTTSMNGYRRLKEYIADYFSGFGLTDSDIVTIADQMKLTDLRDGSGAYVGNYQLTLQNIRPDKAMAARNVKINTTDRRVKNAILGVAAVGTLAGIGYGLLSPIVREKMAERIPAEKPGVFVNVGKETKRFEIHPGETVTMIARKGYQLQVEETRTQDVVTTTQILLHQKTDAGIHIWTSGESVAGNQMLRNLLGFIGKVFEHPIYLDKVGVYNVVVSWDGTEYEIHVFSVDGVEHFYKFNPKTGDYRQMPNSNNPKVIHYTAASPKSLPAQPNPKFLTRQQAQEVLAKNGGIDFNAANLDLQIKRDGQGVPLPLAQQDMNQMMQVQGFVPQIIEIKAAVNLPILSELLQKLQTSSV